jgi:hypothetical protein
MLPSARLLGTSSVSYSLCLPGIQSLNPLNVIVPALLRYLGWLSVTDVFDTRMLLRVGTTMLTSLQLISTMQNDLSLLMAQL